MAEHLPQPELFGANQSEHSNLRQRSTIKIQKSLSPDAPHEPTIEKEVVRPGATNSLTPQLQFEMLRVLGCVLLALLCRMLLKTGYGLLYFQVRLL